MSNIGLNSNIYHATRNYMDLLNNFLVDVNYSSEVGIPINNRTIVEFFKRIADKTNIDPTMKLIRSIFQSHFRENRKDPERSLSEIVTHLENSNLDRNVLLELESLIDVLKYQCDESYARLKGRE